MPDNKLINFGIILKKFVVTGIEECPPVSYSFGSIQLTIRLHQIQISYHLEVIPLHLPCNYFPQQDSFYFKSQNEYTNCIIENIDLTKLVFYFVFCIYLML